MHVMGDLTGSFAMQSGPNPRRSRTDAAERSWWLQMMLATPAWIVGACLLIAVAIATYVAAWYLGSPISQIVAGWAIGGLVAVLACER